MTISREEEVQHLHETDRHITLAERHIREQLLRVDRLHAAGHDIGEAERLLKTMRQTLEAYREHRRLIVEMIEQIGADLA